MAVQKKSNSRRRAVIAQMIEAQDYEQRLANRNVNQVNHLAESRLGAIPRRRPGKNRLLKQEEKEGDAG